MEIQGENNNQIIAKNLTYVIKYYKCRNYTVTLLTSSRYSEIIDIFKEEKLMKNVEIVSIDQKVSHNYFVQLTRDKNGVLLTNRELTKFDVNSDREWMKEHQVKYQMKNNAFTPDSSFKYPVVI